MRDDQHPINTGQHQANDPVRPDVNWTAMGREKLKLKQQRKQK
jgi:hypothetical protein